MRASEPYEHVLGARAMPGAEWFPGARLSYAEHIFRGKDDAATAIHHASELRALDTMSWGELRSLTAEIAGGLRALGVEPATASWPTCPTCPRRSPPSSPARRSAPRGRAARRTSARARWWTASARSSRRCCSRWTATATTAATSIAWRWWRGSRRAMPSLEHTVVLPYLSDAPDLGRLEKPLAWDELLAAGRGGRAPSSSSCPSTTRCGCSTARAPPGLPKAIVHGQGGILLEHLKKMHLHVDAQEGDRVFWFTTTGWMMWNFLVGVLLTPAEIVLYDGSPGHPDLGVLWDLAERTGMTCFGTSAAYIGSCMKGGVAPAAGTRPLGAAQRRLDRLAAGAGGLSLGLRARGRGHLALLHLGRHGRVHRVRGRLSAAAGAPGRASVPGARARRSRPSTRRATPLIGEVGELVITEPMPSMPVSFWNDPERRAAARELLLDVSRHLAPRRLDRDHRARHGGHLRPLGLHHQPRRRAHGHERDLPRGARPRRDRGRPGGGRAARRSGRVQLDAAVRGACARARCSTTRSRPRSGAACAKSARPATSRTR